MYEMLVGYPPFYSDDPMSTCRKVISRVLVFIFHLICQQYHAMPLGNMCHRHGTDRMQFCYHDPHRYIIIWNFLSGDG